MDHPFVTLPSLTLLSLEAPPPPSPSLSNTGVCLCIRQNGAQPLPCCELGTEQNPHALIRGSVYLGLLAASWSPSRNPCKPGCAQALALHTCCLHGLLSFIRNSWQDLPRLRPQISASLFPLSERLFLTSQVNARFPG